MANKDVLLLQQPLKDGGIRSVNFFNGRLLSGKDFSREQAARREADARLGLAIGDGVAFGLEVARDTDLDQATAPVLRIRAGLAVNRLGQTLRLMGDVSVALTRGFDAQASDCIFASCTPLKGGTYVAGAGVYLLGRTRRWSRGASLCMAAFVWATFNPFTQDVKFGNVNSRCRAPSTSLHPSGLLTPRSMTEPDERLPHLDRDQARIRAQGRCLAGLGEP